MSADDRPLLDDKGFNDPEAWGFCDYCIFEVAVVEGRLIEHRRFRTALSPDKSKCKGSGLDPVAPVPLEAEPRQWVSIVKSRDRSQRRAYWQRQRTIKRELMRKAKEPFKESGDGE